MSELRKDPVIGRWVIVAAERGQRPTDYRRPPRRPQGGFCPFCEGNEDKTPPEILAYRPNGAAADGPGWTVRVVPNRYPALQAGDEMLRHGEGMYDLMSGVGAHEVLIESPRHDASLHHLPVEEIREVLWACRERASDLSRDPRFRYVMIFKNQGPEAGATLEHSHMQLIATPIVPHRVTEELTGGETYFRYRERCVFCDIVAQETTLGQGARVVLSNSGFVTLAPFASRCPFEMWILPLRHSARFETATAEEMSDLAAILKDSLLRLEAVLDAPDYNFLLHTAPCRSEDLPHFHWHIEILPKVGQVAGFEWGSGLFINSTSPEEAARALRDVPDAVGAR